MTQQCSVSTYRISSMFQKLPNWTCCAAVDGEWRVQLYFGNKTFHFWKQKCNGTLPLITWVLKLSSLRIKGNLKTTDTRKRKFSSECMSFSQWIWITVYIWFCLCPYEEETGTENTINRGRWKWQCWEWKIRMCVGSWPHIMRTFQPVCGMSKVQDLL